MSLLYPFPDKFKEDFSSLIVKAFNAQRGTNLDPSSFIIALTEPVSDKDTFGLIMITKRTDDFLRLRLRLKEYADFSRVGSFSMKHEMNFSSSLFEIYWEAEMVLERSKFNELSKAVQSTLYKDWVNSDHIIRLEDGGKLMTEYNSFLKYQL